MTIFKAATVCAGTTVPVTFAETLPSATLVAVIVTDCDVVTFGAEYRPVLETVPRVVLQTTPVLLVLSTTAVNCCVAPELTMGSAGVRVIRGWTLVVDVVVVDCGIPAQAVRARAAARMRKNPNICAEDERRWLLKRKDVLVCKSETSHLQIGGLVRSSPYS